MLRWVILACTVLAAVVGATAAGLAVRGMTIPFGLVALVGVAAFHFRREETFVLSLTALAQISIFSLAFVVLTYLGAETARPMIDRHLVACDESLGFHLPSIVAWQQRHPTAGNLLQGAYDSLLLQTAAIIALLGLRGQRRPLELFVLRMMLAALVTLAIFILVPAEGPFRIYGITPSEIQTRYLEHLDALRSGTFGQFCFGDAEGLVTFPSFHAVWAILIVLAVRRQRFVWIPFALLNAAVIVSTMTTGWHYLSDVLAGIVLCTLICWATHYRLAGGLARRVTCWRTSCADAAGKPAG